MPEGDVMNIDAAKEWVDQNRGILAKRAMSYISFAPYAVDDYLQDAYEAAVRAAICCQRNPAVKFEACFYRIWRDLVASVTPFPDEAREEYKRKKEEIKALKEGKPIPQKDEIVPEKKKTYYSGGTSMSFPLTAGKNIPLEGFAAKKVERKKVDIEKVYEQRVKPLLSSREAQAMELSLGITREGQLSLSEIAAKMGVTKDTAREYIQRCHAKVEKGRLIKISDHTVKRTAKNKGPSSASAEDAEQGVLEAVNGKA